ncbi:MAG: hypothetical protein SGPRY_010540, partial [Prymnesium sp.]
ENRSLRKRLEAAERDNRELKGCVYELSLRLSELAERTGRSGRPFELDGPSASLAPLGGEEDGRRGGEGEGEAKETADDDASDPRQFHQLAELKGAGGALYTARFSPSGTLLAAGGFDKCVRCGSLEAFENGEAAVLAEHRHSVSSLSWASDSTKLLSGSYDHTVRLWDAAAAASAASWVAKLDSFVQDVCFHPSETNCFAAAATSKQLLWYDTRQPAASAPTVIINDSMVNASHFSFEPPPPLLLTSQPRAPPSPRRHPLALSCDPSSRCSQSVVVMPNSHYILGGDKEGLLRTWDLRTLRCLSSCIVSEGRKPISGVCLSPSFASRSQARLVIL